MLDSIDQQLRLEEIEYDLIACLLKPNYMMPRVTESFAAHELFENYKFVLEDEKFAEEIEVYGGTIVDSDEAHTCDEVYVIGNKPSHHAACNSRRCHYRTTTWLQDCFNVRSTIFPKEIAMFRHLLHSPWPSNRIGQPEHTMSIAITGLFAFAGASN